MKTKDPKQKPATEEFPLPDVEHTADVPPRADTGIDEIPSDVLGSYTGVPLDREQPEQDQDDL